MGGTRVFWGFGAGFGEVGDGLPHGYPGSGLYSCLSTLSTGAPRTGLGSDLGLDDWLYGLGITSD